MYVKSIKLENIKGFPSLEFNFERPDNTYAGWTVFVGGNGSGKSTLLKCIALALMGPENAALLGTPVGWLREGERRGEIRAQLQVARGQDAFYKKKGPAPDSFEAALRIQLPNQPTDRGSEIASFEAAAPTPTWRGIEPREGNKRDTNAQRGPWSLDSVGWFCAGYGPMRRLSGQSAESIRLATGNRRVARFVTLFREDASLSESERWLTTNHSRLLEAKVDTDESPRDESARARQSELTQLLDGVQAMINDNLLPNGMSISRITVDHVFIRDSSGVELPMRDISDGSRSVYAAILDLIHTLTEVYGADRLFKEKEGGKVVVEHPGVVLIDEIEAHLHPAWQRDIPQWLKEHFPNIQFLVGTHSPLVAQAVDPRGAFFLPAQVDSERVPRRMDDHEVEKLRLGAALKTLLGSAFGLDNTRSYWANTRIRRWQVLNAKRQAKRTLDPTEQSEYEKLHRQMELAFAKDEIE